MAPTAPPFFPPGANGAPFSSVSARFRKTRRYTNVVCCPDMLTANVSPRTRGPWRRMLPPTLSIVSDPSTPQAELLALLAVPHSAMSVGAAWNRVATSVWWPVVETREWNCGTQCEMWGVPLVCLFHNLVTCLVAYHNHCGHACPSAAPSSQEPPPAAPAQPPSNEEAPVPPADDDPPLAPESVPHAACGGKCGHRDASSGKCGCTEEMHGTTLC